MRTKHIKVAYHFIHEKVTSNEVTLTHVQLKDNTVDLMTKALEVSQHHYLCKKLGYLDSGRAKLRGRIKWQFGASGSSAMT